MVIQMGQDEIEAMGYINNSVDGVDQTLGEILHQLKILNMQLFFVFEGIPGKCGTKMPEEISNEVREIYREIIKK
jgi:hypothetical protein